MEYTEAKYSKSMTAKMLGISVDTLEVEIEAGKIKGSLRGKRTKFSQFDIDEYAKNQRVNKLKVKKVYSLDDCEEVERVPV